MAKQSLKLLPVASSDYEKIILVIFLIVKFVDY